MFPLSARAIPWPLAGCRESQEVIIRKQPCTGPVNSPPPKQRAGLLSDGPRLSGVSVLFRFAAHLSGNLRASRGLPSVEVFAAPSQAIQCPVAYLMALDERAGLLSCFVDGVLSH